MLVSSSRHIRPTVRLVCKLQSPLLCRCNHTLSESGLPPPRLDYRNITAHIHEKVENAVKRKAPVDPDTLRSIPSLYAELKEISSSLSQKRHLRSQTGDRIKQAAKSKDAAAKGAALSEATSLKKEILNLEEREASIAQTLEAAALVLPNDTHPHSPIGSEDQARLLSQNGPAILPSHPSRDHVSIARDLELLDLESAALVSGTSFYYLRNEAALLEMALSNYAFSIAIKRGFTPTTTPDIVRYDIAPRCGFQPREGPESSMSQIYYVHSHLGPSASSPDLILAATSEIPIAGMFANKLLSQKSLPIKVAGIGHAFRSEAGARGADTRGLYRVHQFTKVELFVVSDPADSEKHMQEMLELQKEIIDGLDLPYRVLDMPTEELGASAYRKIDIEAWMPGRGSWGEISSLSNCTDYQARRMHIRVDKPVPRTSSSSSSTTLPFAHTLNGTAAAIPRLIVALLENGAVLDSEGRATQLILPKALAPFWLGTNNRDIIQWR